MSKLLIADLTNEKLRRSLGGTVYSLPALNQRSDLYLGLRFSKEVEGVHVVDHPIVREIRVTLGQVDLRSEAGQFSLKVGSGSAVLGTNLTAALDFDCTAAEIATALNALSVVGTAVVVEDDASFLVTGVADAIAAQSNTLRPITFVRVTAYEVDGSLTQAIRLQRAPLAFVDTYTQRVPGAPTITRVQAGGSDGDVTWNEIQKLTVPLDFQGSYQIRSADSIQRSALLGPADTVETIGAAINPRRDGQTVSLGVADDSAGVFTVTQHPSEPAALIEFGGSMAGAGHDLLLVSVFDAPEGDYWITVPLDTAAMTEAFRDTNKLTKIPLEIWVDVEDPDDDEIVRTLPVYRQEVTIHESVTHDDLGTAANIDYLRPPAPKDYTPYNDTQVLTSMRHRSFVKGNGSAITFALDHSLNNDELDVIGRVNTAGGAKLIPGTDFSVAYTNGNTTDVTMLGSYASTPPGNGTLLFTVVDLSAEPTWAEDLEVEVEQVNGLQTILDAYAAEIALLKSQIGASAGSQTSAAMAAEESSWPLLTLFSALRPQTLPAGFEAPAALTGFDAAAAGFRYRSLMGAVHDASAAALTNPVPAANSTHVGNAYVAAAADLTFPGGGIRIDDYAISDGSRWTLANRGWEEGATFTANATGDTIIVANGTAPANGTAILVTSSGGDVPAPLTLSDTGPQGSLTAYYVRDRDANGQTFKLAATSGGSAIDLTGNGTGTHRFLYARDSYYPAEMDILLFTESVLPEDLTLGSVASLQFGFEAAILYGPRRPRDRRTEASWRFVLESGIARAATTPGTPGANLNSIAWTPMIVSDLKLTPTPRPYRFGVEITRSSANALTAIKTIGRSTASATPPNGGTGGVGFYLRARLTMFDTNNSALEPQGLVLLRGLKVGLDGADDANLGKLTIG